MGHITTAQRAIMYAVVNPYIFHDRASVRTIIAWMELGKLRDSGSPLRVFECRAIAEMFAEFPEYETRIETLAQINDEWATLVDNWSEIKDAMNKRDGSYARLMDRLNEELYES